MNSSVHNQAFSQCIYIIDTLRYTMYYRTGEFR